MDGQSIAAFEERLEDNLYKVWNRMSAGRYFPPPVRAVEIPKPGGGTRTLGVPTIADRVAQTVAANRIGTVTERFFHADSYGYRPGAGRMTRSPSRGNAAGVTTGWSSSTSGRSSTACRTISWSGPWKGCAFPPWVLLYVKRWLAAPVRHAGRRGQAEGQGDPAGVCGQPRDR